MKYIYLFNLKVEQDYRDDNRNNTYGNEINHEQRVHLPSNSCKRGWTR